jgi:hypothetical protein
MAVRLAATISQDNNRGVSENFKLYPSIFPLVIPTRKVSLLIFAQNIAKIFRDLGRCTFLLFPFAPRSDKIPR